MQKDCWEQSLPCSRQNDTEFTGYYRLNEKDIHGRTVLEAAIRYGCFECVKLLVDKGVNVNALSSNQTPLNMTLLTNNYEITKYLLDHGAKKELIGRGFFRLMISSTAATKLKTRESLNYFNINRSGALLIKRKTGVIVIT